MLTAKVVFLLLFLLSTRGGQQRLPKSVTSGIDMILLLDFTLGLDESDADSIIQLIDKVFSFTSQDVDLRLTLLIFTTIVETSEWDPRNDKASIQMFLKEQLQQRKGWPTKQKKNRIYGLAFNKSATIFRKDNRRGIKKVAVLITHGDEGCSVNGCLTKDGCYDHSGGCNKSNCTLEWFGQSGSTQANRFVSTEAADLKKLGVTFITIGVGPKSNATRLKCWASSPDMSIQMKSFSELRQEGAKQILDLMPGAGDKRTSGKTKSDWRPIVVGIVLLIALVIVVLLFIAIVRWWKKEKRSLTPVVQGTGGEGPIRYSRASFGPGGPKKVSRHGRHSFTDPSTDLCSTQDLEGSRLTSFMRTREKQPAFTKPSRPIRKRVPKPAPKPSTRKSPERSEPTRSFGLVPSFKKTPPKSTNEPTASHPIKEAGNVGKAVGKYRWPEANMTTKRSTRDYETVIPETSGKVLPKSPEAKPKTPADPEKPACNYQTNFRSLN